MTGLNDLAAWADRRDADVLWIERSDCDCSGHQRWACGLVGYDVTAYGNTADEAAAQLLSVISERIDR